MASAVVKKPKGKAGQLPDMPPSLAEPWLPFTLDAKRIAVLSDLHVPYHDDTAVRAAVGYCKARKPDALLINGDLADFYSISRHQKNPKHRNLAKEMEIVRECLAWLRASFGKACRVVMKLGNHEERWQHWLWNHAPEISDSPRMKIDEWIDAEKLGIEVVHDQRPIICGRLPVFHGHELPRGMASPVNPARGAFTKTGGTMLVAHSHRTSQHNEPDWQHKDTVCWSQGCLCDMTPEYARINKWNHGFAVIEVAAGGDFSVDNRRIGPDGEVWQ